MKPILLFSLIFLFASNVSYAVTLSEAIDATLQNNSELKLEQSRFDREKANRGDAISEFLPDIKATYQKGRQKNDAVGLDRGQLDTMNDQDVKQLTLTQPVFSGFSGIHKAKEIKSNIKQAKFYYLSKKDEILLKTVESYMNLYFTQGSFELQSKNEEYSTTLLRLIRQRNRLGQVGGGEVINYQTRLFNDRSDVLLAKQELFKAKQEFESNIGIDSGSLFLPAVDQNRIIDNEDELVNLALENNYNLKQHKFKIKSAKASLNQNKGAFSPKAELSASLSEQENVTYLNNRDLKSKSIYLNITVPIFQKGSEYFNLRKSNKDLIFSKREFANKKDILIKDVKKAHKEYLFYSNLVNSDQDLIKLLKNKMRKLRQQFRVGEGDIIDLLVAKVELNEILERELEHQVSYTINYYKLLSLIGSFDVDNNIRQKVVSEDLFSDDVKEDNNKVEEDKDDKEDDNKAKDGKPNNIIKDKVKKKFKFKQRK